jgi:choline dehydrogenase-like flavoprotein
LDTARARYFGGSINRWHVDIGNNLLGARMRPLDGIDFEERAWVPYSGWPFDKSHLDPFYERAQQICRIGRYAYDPADWEDPLQTPRLQFCNDSIKTVIFQFGSREPFLRDCRNEITSADNVKLFLRANVLEIETDMEAQKVTRLSVGSLEGNRFFISAKLFILAAGGIETPRLMLLSNRIQQQGLGNQNDLVGRFFMEHLHFWSGIYIPADADMPKRTRLYNAVHLVNNVPVIGKLSVSEQSLRQEKLLNGCIQLIPRIILKNEILSYRQRNRMTGRHNSATAGTALSLKVRGFMGKMLRGRKAIFRLANMTEQAPNPDSRVALGEETDDLGLRQASLDWKITGDDILSVLRFQKILDREVRRAGLGEVLIDLNDGKPPQDLHGGYHHMGTTRMHTDPRKGVVDGDCRAHGMANLFIAGPSVFPTGGYANPVLTIVALAVRLADHVKWSLSKRM